MYSCLIPSNPLALPIRSPPTLTRVKRNMKLRLVWSLHLQSLVNKDWMLVPHGGFSTATRLLIWWDPQSSLTPILCVCAKLFTLQKETVEEFHTLGGANERFQTIGLITLKCQPTQLPSQVLIGKRQRSNEGRFFHTSKESRRNMWLVKPCVCSRFFSADPR